MNDSLTILLTLRGRHLHTLRWLWHANRVALPFHVIIADGQVHPAIDRLLSTPAAFSDLSFEYRRYDDRSLADFYAKCADAVDRVATPYVMMSDNDDFLLPSGLSRCVDFLEEAPDFACAMGGIPGFSTERRAGVWDTVLGRVDRIAYRCHDDGSYDSRDIDQPTAAERVTAEARRFLSIYYAVYRTDALRTIMTEIDELQPSDLLIHEFFAALRALTLGKAAGSARYFSYFRQGNSSSQFSSNSDWIGHLLRSPFARDFQTMTARITAAATDDAASAAALEGEIVRGFSGGFRSMLTGLLLQGRFPKLYDARQKVRRIRGRLKPPRAWRLAKEERAFWRALAHDGATPDTIADHRREIAEVRRTLASAEFVDFVQRNAPELLDEAG